MIKKFLQIMVVVVTAAGFAQEGAVSPYSYYGLGIDGSRATMENQAMGGMGIIGDSIHTNLINPAGYGALKLTNFTLGLSHRNTALSTAEGSGSINSTTVDYLSLAFPVSKRVGVGFGLLPYTSVDYNVVRENEDDFDFFSGEGGVNQVFLSAGAEIFKGFRLGAAGRYNFGRITNESIEDNQNVGYAVRELNRSDVSGFSFDLGLQYDQRFKGDYRFTLGGSYSLEGNLTSENSRQVQTGLFSREETAFLNIFENREVTVGDDEITLPARYRAGLGFGKFNKWFLGAEYGSSQVSSFSGRFLAVPDADYRDANQYRLGGYYIPRYNSISSYWGRVTYRAGLRYEETGLFINNEGVNEFGISFGLGLPLSKRTLSSLNVFLEYGQRGTTQAGLIQEDIFKVGLSLSLNAKWFQPFKFN